MHFYNFFAQKIYFQMFVFLLIHVKSACIRKILFRPKNVVSYLFAKMWFRDVSSHGSLVKSATFNSFWQNSFWLPQSTLELPIISYNYFKCKNFKTRYTFDLPIFSLLQWKLLNLILLLNLIKLLNLITLGPRSTDNINRMIAIS
jgi:hypothetical protein